MFLDFHQSDSDNFDQRPQRRDAPQTPMHPTATPKAEGLDQQFRPQKLLGQPDADRIGSLRLLDELEAGSSGPKQRDDNFEAALSTSDPWPGVSNLDGTPRQVEKVRIVNN